MRWGREFGVAVVALIVGGMAFGGRDAVRAGLDGGNPSSNQIVVYEARTSPYAAVFRDMLLPSVRRVASSVGAAVRFVDVTATADDGPGLSEPISVVPTLVVFEDGHEQGRITGLFGPDEYARLLAGLLRRP